MSIPVLPGMMYNIIGMGMVSAFCNKADNQVIPVLPGTLYNITGMRLESATCHKGDNHVNPSITRYTV